MIREILDCQNVYYLIRIQVPAFRYSIFFKNLNLYKPIGFYVEI